MKGRNGGVEMLGCIKISGNRTVCGSVDVEKCGFGSVMCGKNERFKLSYLG